MTKIQEINAYLVLQYEEKFLVLKRPNGIWEFPGGGVGWGEHPREAALRETEEETSVKVKDAALIGVTSATYEKSGDQKHSIYLVYLAETEGDRVKLSKEHLEFRWVTLEELKTIKLGLNAIPILKIL